MVTVEITSLCKFYKFLLHEKDIGPALVFFLELIACLGGKKRKLNYISMIILLLLCFL